MNTLHRIPQTININLNHKDKEDINYDTFQSTNKNIDKLQLYRNDKINNRRKITNEVNLLFDF